MIRFGSCWIVALCLVSLSAWGGGLTGSAALAPAQVDLTIEGTSDWAHWGHTSVTDFDQKATGGSQISNYSDIGGTGGSRGSNQESSYSWSNGSPTAIASASATGVRVFSLDRGFSFTAPADTESRTLTVYVGARQAVGELIATLSDSSAPAYSVEVDSLTSKSSFAITLTYEADSAAQELTVEYTLKSLAAGQTGWAALESATLSGGSGNSGGGAISVSASVAANLVDLTAQGVDDWVHWGLSSASSFDRKAGVSSQISDYSVVDGASPSSADNIVAGYSWNDGTPTSAVSNSTTGLKVFSAGKGYTFTANADTTPRVLDVYVGINSGVGELSATLSDGSAPPVSLEITENSGKASYRIRLNYQAESAGETLTVTYILKSETNASSAWASLESATLVGGGGGNAPPTLNPIGDRSLAEGSQLLLGISATDVDGPAPITFSQTNTLPGSPNVLTDNGDGTGVIDWQSVAGDAAGGPYSITVQATDAEGAMSQETFTVTVFPAGSGGSLSGAQQLAPGIVNLTTEGVNDWVHWGLNSSSALDRKASVTAQISDYTPLGGATPSSASNIVAGYSWSDGQPTAAATNTTSGLKVFNVDGGFAFSAPADVATRTLKIYLGVNRGTGELTAMLSDGSAAPYVTELVELGNKSTFLVTISYAAGSDGEVLNVEYSLKSKANPSSAWISLESAALVGAASGNAVPVLNPIGDQLIAEGQQLLVGVTASDIDGPAPLVLSATNTLPGNPTILTDNADGTGVLNWQSNPGDAAGSPYSIVVRAEDGLGAFVEETITVTVASGGAGLLSGAAATAPASVNLSSVGGFDWAHWGLSSASSFNHKASGGGQISDYSTVGGANPAQGSNLASAYSWNDGTPTAAQSNTSTGIRVFSEGKGFSFTVPADTSPRTLYAYVGARHGTGDITATLSDGSAPPFTAQVVTGSSKRTWLVVLNYSAASAGQQLTFEYVLSAESNPSAGWASLEAAALADGAALELPYVEDFSSGAPNWMTVDDTTASSDWQAIGGVYRQNNAMGITANAMSGAAHIGTYSYLANGSELTDYSLSVTATPLASSGQDVGVMFRLNPAAGYYLRLSFSGANSFGRLELANAGVFATRAKDARGVLPGIPVDIEVRVKGPVVMAYRDGQLLYGAYEQNLSSGTVGLYCRDACEFDDLLIDVASAQPAIAIASPVAYSVSAGTSLDVAAVVMNAPAGATVSFDMPGASSPCGSATEVSPGHYTASCTLGGDGLYVLNAELRSATNTLLASDSRTNVGVGVNYVSIGDSITAGLDDPTASDGIAANGFVRGVQGYQARLNDLLDAAGQTAVVFNNGVPGDKSVELANDRITGILQRHPDASHLLMTIGVNDAGGAAFTDSGLGCSGASCDGTFAGYVQDVVDDAVGSGKQVVLAQTPPRFGDPLQVPHLAPDSHPQNLLIENEYNQVILTQITNVTAGPDFYDFFLGEENRFYLYETNLHPNALGYRAMAILFDQVLSGSTAEPFFARNLCLRESLGAPCQAPLSYKQNLLDIDGELYIDATHTLVTAPAVLDDGRWIQTADADLDLSNADYLQFDLLSTADVYVAYDDAAATVPAWLSGFTVTADTITTSNPAADVLRLYRQAGAIGTVTLGGADAASTGAGSNYLVIIVD